MFERVEGAGELDITENSLKMRKDYGENKEKKFKFKF